MLAWDQPCPCPHLPSHTWSGALGGKAAGGGQIKPEGASQETSSLTPEMTATASLPARPRSRAKGGPVSLGRTWSLPALMSPECSQHQVCDMAHKRGSNWEASPHVTSDCMIFIFTSGERDRVREDLPKVRSAFWCSNSFTTK